MSDSRERHRSRSESIGSLAIAVVTVSDSRTRETDANGEYLADELERLGHRLASRRVVPDDTSQLAGVLDDLENAGIDVILFNGGTGISTRDRTFDFLESRMDKILPGFGELFRMLSYDQVGSAAMLSRAIAGVCGKSLVFSMPGSPKAVQLAWKKLIEPELKHLVWEMRR